MSEFLLKVIRYNAELHEGDLIQTLVLATVVNANFQQIVRGEETSWRQFEALDAVEVGGLRPVSVNAISKSMGVSFETARRAAGRLIERGYCTKTPRGLVVSIGGLTRGEIVSAETVIVDNLDETFKKLVAIGFDFQAFGGIGSSPAPGEVPAGPAPVRLVYWLAIEFVILSTSKFIPLFGSLTTCLIYMGAMSLNARRITHDADAAWSFSQMDAPPPDRLRVPVTLREIAEELNLNLLTVRRHVSALVRSGDFKPVKGGFLVSMQSLQSDRLLIHSPQVAMHFIRLIRELDRVGYALPRNSSAAPQLLSA